MNIKVHHFFIRILIKYILQCFHIGGVVEYHDCWLRILLSRYVSCIDGNTEVNGDLVLNDNRYLKL